MRRFHGKPTSPTSEPTMPTTNTTVSPATVATAGLPSTPAVRAAHADAIDAKRAAAKAKREAKAAKPAAKAAKPGKPAKRSAAVTVEPEADKRTVRAERIAADRTDVAAFYAAFEANRSSIPVKPLSAFKPQASTAHPIDRNPSVRQAAAICAAFASAGVKLADGAKAPRVFDLDGKRSCIENGAMRDAISSGLIAVSGGSPETETLTIRAKQANVIAGLIGAKALKAAKLA